MKTTARTSFKIQTIDIIPLVLWVSVVIILRWFLHEVQADRFLRWTPEAFGKYFSLRWILVAHVLAGSVAIISGIIQFWPKLRNYNWKLHRALGFIYLLSIVLSGTSALILAFTTAYEVNWANAFTLQIWASVWLGSTFIAYYAIARKKVNLHKQWMTRSYIVTMAFLISGIAYRIPYVQQLGSYEELATVLFWMGWAVPLFVYEIIRSCKEI